MREHRLDVEAQRVGLDRVAHDDHEGLGTFASSGCDTRGTSARGRGGVVAERRPTPAASSARAIGRPIAPRPGDEHPHAGRTAAGAAATGQASRSHGAFGVNFAIMKSVNARTLFDRWRRCG